VEAESTKDGRKPTAATNSRSDGKALSETLALKPERGKPAFRNFRGGDGNVGIIRSPVRAIALPDYRKGEQRIHPGLESCRLYREVSLEA
jgi:hypothetical protein